MRSPLLPSIDLLMASYKLISDDGASDLRLKACCALRIDSGGDGDDDVESAYLKSNAHSPRLRPPILGGIAKCVPPSGRLVSLDVFRGLTVVVKFSV